MKYTSTRDGNVAVNSSTAVIDGISSDGGLYVPVELPKLDYKTMLEASYTQRADAVLSAFFDFDVSGIAEDAYKTFQTDDPAPVVKLDEKLFVLELWHGRTHAFKDMALSVLPRLLPRAKAAENNSTQTLILVATSGDTGKAALEGFRDVEGTQVVAFYPTDGVSDVQKLAMQTQLGKNVAAVGIRGNFDDAQAAVKKAFADDALVAALKRKGIALSSANSINIGRLVPQIAYYFSAYCDLVNADEIKRGEQVDFVVPTGNFGNILAGYYAREMGLPVNRLVCASNKNKVLTEFIETGIYDSNREFYKTTSPSMDILVSSNLERLLYLTSEKDCAVVRARMQELKEKGIYQVTPSEIEKIRTVISAGSADDEACAQAIADMFDEYGYLIDPHTAAAYSVAREREFGRPTVIVSTANPFKFAPAVLDALGEKAPKTADLATLEKLSEITAMDVPQTLADVFAAEIRFPDVIDSDKIIDYIADKFAK